MNNIPRYFTISLATILIFINVLYYFSIQGNLVTNQEEKIELIVHNISSSIQENHDIEVSFNHFLAEDLRETSLSIQKELPSDIEDVTTEQLAELEAQHSLKGITLFVQKGDDVVSAKSSNEGEVGLSAKKFLSSEWHSMLMQLLSKHNVQPIDGFGHALENFWAGPVARSKSNPNMVTKWGYYNDGTTNYILNLFVERNVLDAYYETAGLEKKLEHFTENNPYVLNVSVVNGEAVLNGVTQKDDAATTSSDDRLFVGGKNRYPTSEDEEKAMSAMKENRMIHFKAESKDRAILKSYFPAEFKTQGKVTDKLLIVVTSDFDKINSELFNRITKNVIVSTIIFLSGLVAIFIAISAIRRRERTIESVQDMYVRHVENIHETIREHRHDMNHHLYTISGMASMGLTEELTNYVNTLVSIHKDTVDMVDISIPALSGIIQVKRTQARDRDIEFEHHFSKIDTLDIRLDKLTDLVKATGNILDNAFHAVEDSVHLHKKVSIYGKLNNNVLTISISNNGPMIPIEKQEALFHMGVTSRAETGGSGVGLASSKKAVERYKGNITLTSTPELTTFTITMPISKREIRKVAR